jgi:hypoxanthine phosphoribosyltransferase/uncharacterized HAD superfamily protein
LSNWPSKIEWRNYNDLVALCRANAFKIRDLKPDLVVGIPRSGMVPASMLALDLLLPLADLYSFCEKRSWHFRNTLLGAEAKRIVLVDDSIGTGKSFRMAAELISEARPGTEIITVAAYASPEARTVVDVALEVCPKPRLFEWNWHRSWKVKYCAFDIDGVLCRDPTRDEKQDISRYLRFLKGAEPLFKPIRPVGALVTGRLEAYRSETADWMARNGIEFSELSMLQGSPPRGGGIRAESKADFYKKSRHALFFESSPKQAEIIAKQSGKDVVCMQTRELHKGQ